jgi:transposase
LKIRAAKIVSERGLSVAQTSIDLDLHQTVLRKWVKEFSGSPREAFLGHCQMKPEQQQRLRREGVKLKGERGMLKSPRRLSPPVRGRNGLCYVAVGRVAADGLLEA